MAELGAVNGSLAQGSLEKIVENITANLTENLAADLTANLTSSTITSGNVSALAAARAAFSFSDPASIKQLLYAYRHVFFMEGRILVLALGIIYVGAHASLSRPHSAAPRDDDGELEDESKLGKDGQKAKKKKKRTADVAKESLRLSDALLMPVFAAGALIGMYYLIKYMQDPALLNRIIRAYTSLVAVASVGSFLGDGLSLASSLVFPNVWTSRRDGRLYRVDATKRLQWVQKTNASATAASTSGATATTTATWEEDTSRTTPFPDLLAAPLQWLPASTAASVTSFAWAVRRVVRESWSIHVSLRGVGSEEVEGLSIHALTGLALAAAAVYLDYFLGLFPSLLNNVMGLGLSYFALQVVSGTSFAIGSTVLLGLFLYDIVMVFYTPFMVTVATTVEAPIKIVAASGGQSGMLGLGDIVVPGIYICLCLRYDLYQYYVRQIQHVETTLATTEQASGQEDKNTDSTTTTTTTKTATREIKAPYIDPQGRWGDRVWTWTANPTTPGLTAARFSKPYFVTSMVAYVIGLMGAMLAMLITRKGQPALFYLVPVMLLATWGRAALIGDLKGMWAYTEDSSLDTKDVVVDVDADGKPIKKDDEEKEKGKEKVKEDTGNERDVFVFAIRAPPETDFFEMDI
ncbi:hypothetical protein SBRCBS47491_003114 [Sporothrix bragantina]|uniref:Signal peptide peptidase n=1 Tax=Sporothrix bragantina TaxID=671064 RepID=A0ABP0BCM0_9PEZI